MERNPGELKPGRLRKIQDVNSTEPDKQDQGTSPDQSSLSPIHALWVWALTIFVLSVMPAPPPGPITVSDTLVHATFYAPLGALLFWTLPRESNLKKWAMSALGAFAFGFFIELVQEFLPTRTFEWTDAAANLAGGAVGSAFALRFPRLYLLSIFK